MTEPHNLEAEGAVIGAILREAEAFHAVAGLLRPEHFFDAFHAALFAALGKLIRAGRSPSIAALKPLVDAANSDDFDAHEYVRGLWGGAWVGATGAPDLAGLIVDAARHRQFMRATLEAHNAARSASSEAVAGQITELQRLLTSLVADGVGDSAAPAGDGIEPLLDDFLAPNAKPRGVPTGLSAIDGAGGFARGSLTVVAGRPSMGKTALSLSLARGIAEAGFGVVFASLEMPRRDVKARLLTDLARGSQRVAYADLLRGRRYWPPSEERALRAAGEALRALPLIVDDASQQSADHIAAVARKAAREWDRRGVGMGAVVVDYLGLMARDRDLRADQAIGDNAAAMKALAKDLNCACLLLCQLNRQTEARDTKRPTLGDLRDSGNIEEHADSVWLLFRPEYYVERNPKSTDEERVDARGVLNAFVDKNRNGPVGTMTFDVDVAANAVRNVGEISKVKEKAFV